MIGWQPISANCAAKQASQYRGYTRLDVPNLHRHVKLVERKPAWHWHEGAVSHKGYRPFCGDMHAVDENGK